ncbi:hypothetical protein L5515_007764 [Caenorhabditis briggsae]|uniref:Uncharacterized protein n=2 Tax=Caenorhabditis briggsae TaxID=6238 RepID=A0AAE9EZH2_CAEBR|nr:hypothetical protein L5515_007764 [Caenorhabditis briggsae]
MKCIYKEFMRKKEDLKVEYTQDMRIRFIESGMMILAEENQQLRELISTNSDRKRRKKKIGKRVMKVRKSEESSDYSTSKKFKSLLKNLDSSETSEDDQRVVFQYAHHPYKTLPDVLQNLNKSDCLKYCSSSEDEDKNASTRISYSTIQLERYPKFRNTKSTDVTFNDLQGICNSYKSVGSATKGGKSREKRSRSYGIESRKEEQCMIDTLTLGECLLQSGLPADDVICCTLCRLLIPTTSREEFFMRPCSCRDVFVHSKCSHLYRYQMVRQKCSSCEELFTARVPASTNLPKSNGGTSRIPVEYESECYLCFGTRTVRDGRNEELDSKIVKACRCPVTAHNECLVQFALSTRKCDYCHYRFQIATVGPQIEYFNRKTAPIYGLQVASIVFLGITLILWSSNWVVIPNHTLNVTVKNVFVALILITTTYLLISVIRTWTRKSYEIDKDTSALVRPYKTVNRIGDGSNSGASKMIEKYEELPLEEMMASYARSNV